MRSFPKRPSHLPLSPMADYTQRAKSIKFRASWVDPNSYGLVKAKEITFEHGLGPCGRHVVSLAYEVTEELLTIRQWSRSPELLHEPQCHSQWKLDRHQRLERSYRPAVTLKRQEERVTGFLWWRKSEWVDVIETTMGDREKPEGLLEDSEVETLKAEVREHWAAVQKWNDDLEVKTFVYKMADVHGRIEVVK